MVERDYAVLDDEANSESTDVVAEWQMCTLGELTENFDALRIPVKQIERQSGPYPYYGASGIVDHVNGFLFDGQYLLIAEDGENLRTRTTPIAFLATGKFWVNNHAHIVRGSGNADTRFLMYALAGLDISGYLTGSTMPKLTQGNMNRIALLTPPLPGQRAIAHVLGTLDDKIELNRRMNETLEEMARALFKSWFVDFDPVRAKMEGRWRRGESLPGLPADLYDLFPDRMVPSELGEIPEGWEVKALGEVANVSSGKRPGHRSSVANDEAQIPLWGGNGPMAFVAEPLVDFPILLTGRVGTLGSVFRITKPCWPSDNTLIVTTKSSQFFDCLFFQMERIDFDSLNRGSTQPLLTQSDLKAQLVLLPPANVLNDFHKLTFRLLESNDHRRHEAHTLSVQRDTLLPKLVSGEMRVGNI